jgi:ABC-type multidrug transport system fused ATPase/permease subunit
MAQPPNDRKIVSLEEGRRTRAREEAKRKQTQQRLRWSARLRKIPVWITAVAVVFILGLGVFLYDLNRYTTEFGSVDAALKHMAGAHR